MMAGVRFPTDDSELISRIVAQVWEELDCYVVVFGWSGRNWVRLSAQIYNEQEDFVRMGQRVLELVNELSWEFKK